MSGYGICHDCKAAAPVGEHVRVLVYSDVLDGEARPMLPAYICKTCAASNRYAPRDFGLSIFRDPSLLALYSLTK